MNNSLARKKYTLKYVKESGDVYKIFVMAESLIDAVVISRPLRDPKDAFIGMVRKPFLTK